MDNRTIVAIATPNGIGGIGIIKISGRDALQIGASIFRKRQISGNKNGLKRFSIIWFGIFLIQIKKSI